MLDYMRDNGYSTCLRGKIVFTPPRRSFFVHRILHIRIIHCQNNSFHVTLKFFPIYSIPIYLHLASAFFFHLNKRFSITRNRFANRSLNHRNNRVETCVSISNESYVGKKVSIYHREECFNNF